MPCVDSINQCLKGNRDTDPKKDLCKAQHCECVNTNDPDENNNTDEFSDYDDDFTDSDYKPPKKRKET